MLISEAQREVRVRFAGGSYGHLVAGLIWLVSAALATWSRSSWAISELVIGGCFIFPITELLIRLDGRGAPLSADNSLHQLGMQVAFVLPLSMPLLIPVSQFRLTLFYPALMILVGAHYLPFIFMYGMRQFAILAALLLGGGVLSAKLMPHSFAIGAWFTAATLLAFAILARVTVRNEAQNPENILSAA